MSYVVSCMLVFDEAVIYVEFSRMRLEVRCAKSRKEVGSRNLLLNFPKRTVNLTETGCIYGRKTLLIRITSKKRKWRRKRKRIIIARGPETTASERASRMISPYALHGVLETDR